MGRLNMNNQEMVSHLLDVIEMVRQRPPLHWEIKCDCRRECDYICPHYWDDSYSYKQVIAGRAVADYTIKFSVSQ